MCESWNTGVTSQREEVCSVLRLTNCRQGSVGWRDRQIDRTRRTRQRPLPRGLTSLEAMQVKARCPPWGRFVHHILEQNV